jgi:hypothetical protein
MVGGIVPFNRVFRGRETYKVEKRIMRNIEFARKSFLAIVACSGAAISSAAFAQAEVEPNDAKGAANAVALPGSNAVGVITGNTTGTSTSTPGAGSADYFRVTVPASTAGIYVNTLTITTTGTAGHTGSIRGLTQTANTCGSPGTINAGTDSQFQTSSTATTPSRTNRWYTFGAASDIYYRVTGTTSTTANYSVDYTVAPVTPVAGPTSIVEGAIEISTVAQTTVDTDMWLYDSSFNPIPGAGNDDEGTAGCSSGTLQSKFTRTLGPGTYYLAISRFGFANDQASPADDDFRSGTVLDFPGSAVCSSSTTTAADLDVLIGGTPVTVLGATTTGFDVQFVQFTVIPATGPTPPTGVGSATPNSVNNCGTGTTLLTVVTTPGNNPVSTGITVAADLSAIGGSSTQSFFDDGTNGDVTGGDGTYSYLASIANTVTAGAKTLPFVVADAELRSSNGNINMTVTQCPPMNDECANAMVALCGSTAFNTASSTVSTGFTYCAGSGGDVFFSFTAPASGPTVVDTCGSTGDTVVAVYASCAGGASIACNDDADPPAPPPCDTSLSSYLTFTATQGTTYIIGVRSFGTTAASGNLNITCSTGISGTASATPASVFSGTPLPGGTNTSLLTCTVFPATTPPSTGITVSADLSALGGSATQSFFDDGTNGDVTAGDNIFSYAFNASASTPGAYTITCNIADAELRTATATTALSVNSGVVDLGTLDATSSMLLIDDAAVAAASVRWFKFTLGCEMNAADLEYFDLDTLGSIVGDTEIGLYDATGGLLASDDDGAGTLKSLLTFGTGSLFIPAANGVDGAVLAAGDYYLAIGVFNMNFNPTGFGVTSTGGAGVLDVNLHTNLACGPVCDSLDFNNDGVSPDTGDIDDFLSVFGGGPCSTDPTPGCNDLDFNNDGVAPDTTDIDAFLSVFGGGPCL